MDGAGAEGGDERNVFLVGECQLLSLGSCLTGRRIAALATARCDSAKAGMEGAGSCICGSHAPPQPIVGQVWSALISEMDQ